ncbi:MAG: N-acetylmuramoyl-L-alanine amidase family protein [Acidimicrobiales bacterium]
MTRWMAPAVTAVMVLSAACGSGSGQPAGRTTSVPGTAAATTVAAGTTVPLPPTTVSAGAARLVLSSTGVLVPVVKASPSGGWTVRTPCSNTVHLAAGTPLGGATVVLDPGHGGGEPGAVSPAGLVEAPVNLAVASHARAALEAAGVAVAMTRTGSYDVDLPTRAAIAKAADARLFVSVHHNAEPDGPSARPGSETYYQQASADSKRLAGLIYEDVVGALAGYRVGWVADRDAGAKYRPGSRGDYYAVLRLGAPTVSVLAELAFISNPAEAALLSRPDFQEVEGRALAAGILRYLNSPAPGSGFVVPYPRTDPPGGTPAPPCREPAL